jgi:threonine/homoserine/homoserine lactone efflux protein
MWWLFAASEFVLCLTPGPAVLFVLSSALRAGGRKSIASNIGILAANTLYFLISATSVGAVLVASYRLFFAVKWIGAAYLIWIGLRSIFGKAGVVNAHEGKETRVSRLFSGGFMTQVSNPKAIVFFTAFLPQFIDPHGAIGPQIAILAATSIVIEFSILTAYGFAAGRATELARQPRYAAWTNRVAGTLLVGAGAGLATLRRG